MKKENHIKKNVPTLKPIDFDDFFFGDWKAPIGSSYSNFHIERIETYKDHLKLPVLPHRRSVFHFLFITTGKVKRTKILNEYEILPNHFFFMPADTTTTIESITEDTTGYYCHFKPDIFQHPNININLQKDFPFFQRISNPLVRVENSEFLLSSMQLLEQEKEKKPIHKTQIIGLLLLTLLTEVKHSAHFSTQGISNKNAAYYLTIKFKKALADYIYEKTKVSEFADYLTVTPNHLNKCVKATTGKSAHKLLGEMRILEAKVLLTQSDLSIAEIAYKIGKMDHSDFARFFKSKTQMTPKQYRNHILKNI